MSVDVTGAQVGEHAGFPLKSFSKRHPVGTQSHCLDSRLGGGVMSPGFTPYNPLVTLTHHAAPSPCSLQHPVGKAGPGEGGEPGTPTFSKIEYQPDCFLPEPGWFDQPVDEPLLERLPCRNRPSGEDHVESVLLTDQPGQALCPSPSRNDAKCNFRL